MIGVNLQTSFLTPPFGFALFYLRGAAGPEIKTGDIYRGSIPLVAIQMMSLVVLWFMPGLATALPNAVYGPESVPPPVVESAAEAPVSAPRRYFAHRQGEFKVALVRCPQRFAGKLAEIGRRRRDAEHIRRGLFVGWRERVRIHKSLLCRLMPSGPAHYGPFSGAVKRLRCRRMSRKSGNWFSDQLMRDHRL